MTSTPRAIAVIPARYESSRFPGKPLAARTGKPLIQHVVEHVRQAQRISRIIVATDDRRIYDATRAFGCEAAMTSPDHTNGTSRIAEVAADFPDPQSIVVNVQGDEPEIEPEVIDRLVDGLLADPDAPMATLASEFSPDENPGDPNIVKLVVGVNGRALYFSRSLIPFDRDGTGYRPLKHPGLYAYRQHFLVKYARLPVTPLENAEKLEQLRALEHGHAIAVVKVACRHHGIDTPAQYDDFVRRHTAGSPSSGGAG